MQTAEPGRVVVSLGIGGEKESLVRRDGKWGAGAPMGSTQSNELVTQFNSFTGVCGVSWAGKKLSDCSGK